MSCSARAAASITTPLPVPAGPTRIAARSGPVIVLSAWSLLVAKARADPLGELVGGGGACRLAYVPAGGLGELGDPALDRLLFRAHGERRHPPALQREHTALGDHRSCPVECVGWGEFAGGLLKQHRA